MNNPAFNDLPFFRGEHEELTRSPHESQTQGQNSVTTSALALVPSFLNRLASMLYAMNLTLPSQYSMFRPGECALPKRAIS